MKAIVFLNTQKSGSSRDALLAAKELGYAVILFTDRLSIYENRDEFPEVTKMIYGDTKNLNYLRNKIQSLIKDGYEIDAIISFNDGDVYHASLLADEFGVGRFTTVSYKWMEDKILSRLCLRGTPYNPYYRILNIRGNILDQEIFTHMPLVVKNPLSTGSKEVFLVKNTFEFFERMDYLLNNRVKYILLEEYLNGPQYLVETMVIKGKVHIIAVIEQDIYMYNGRSIVVGYSLHYDYDKEFYERLKSTVNDIIKHFELENGTCHLELRYINKQWKLIEINPRIAGSGMNEMIRYSLGINLVKETLKLALGLDVDLTPRISLPIYAAYLVSPISGKLFKVTGKQCALESEGVISVYVKPKKGSWIYLPTSMGHRYARVIATGKDPLEAKINAKSALNKIKLHIRKE